MAKVMLLRRDVPTLTDIERNALQKAFGEDVEFVRCDPTNYVEHAENCERLQPDAVLLPLERPIPSQAMDEGFMHIAIVDGAAMELEPMKVSFKPIT